MATLDFPTTSVIYDPLSCAPIELICYIRLPGSYLHTTAEIIDTCLDTRTASVKPLNSNQLITVGFGQMTDVTLQQEGHVLHHFGSHFGEDVPDWVELQ